jgi:hypothetical protein
MVISKKLYPSGRKNEHRKQDRTMAPARDICLTVDAFTITNWNFDELQSHPSGAKNQVEVSKRIKVTEKGTIFS